jgi:type IV pilus biogenesis protein CpaD/CtpE
MCNRKSCNEQSNCNNGECKPACECDNSIIDADNTICDGTSVTFTATPTNGGTTPSYQWKLNGNNVGTDQATYTTSTLVNGDVVTVVLTSNYPCATGNPATSNPIATTVNANQPVSVSIASSDADNTICDGTSVTFTATPTNGGTTPSYQWKLNGNNVGTDQATYTTTTLANGDVVTVVLTSTITPCATGNPATSNAIATTVIANEPVSVTIASSDADNIICDGTSVTFTGNTNQWWNNSILSMEAEWKQCRNRSGYLYNNNAGQWRCSNGNSYL